jgi:hypothetical protein
MQHINCCLIDTVYFLLYQCRRAIRGRENRILKFLFLEEFMFTIFLRSLALLRIHYYTEGLSVCRQLMLSKNRTRVEPRTLQQTAALTTYLRIRYTSSHLSYASFQLGYSSSQLSYFSSLASSQVRHGFPILF